MYTITTRWTEPAAHAHFCCGNSRPNEVTRRIRGKIGLLDKNGTLSYANYLYRIYLDWLLTFIFKSLVWAVSTEYCGQFELAGLPVVILWTRSEPRRVLDIVARYGDRSDS
jgi:hypothetical protein